MSEINQKSDQEFLTFRLGEEEYGVDILKVQEIRGWEKPTPLPETAGHIKGVINLRGSVVPIVDMRKRFGFSSSYDETTVVIVLSVGTDDANSYLMGLVVDAVSDVYRFNAEEIQPAPQIIGSIEHSNVSGLVEVQGRMVILLDIQQLVSVGLLQAAIDVAA